jgi:hypothetical protein
MRKMDGTNWGRSPSQAREHARCATFGLALLVSGRLRVGHFSSTRSAETVGSRSLGRYSFRLVSDQYHAMYCLLRLAHSSHAPAVAS